MSLEQLKTLDGTQAVTFCVATTKQERYQWVQNTLVTFRYMQSNKADNGLKRIYTKKDIRLLAQTDELHQQPSGGGLKSCVNANGHYLGIPPVQPKEVNNLSTATLYLH